MVTRMHDRSVLVDTAQRLLALHEAGTTTLEPDVYRNPVSVYVDPNRFDRERDVLFRRTPLALALSCELTEPGAYRTLSVVGSPVVVVRGDDGAARAFLNVCRHRGGRVVADRGCSRRLTCDYHNWSYDTAGRLVGVPGAAGFERVDRETAGLVELSTAERHGIIWGQIDPSAPLDLDAHLGPLDAELAELGLEDLTHVGTRDLPADCNWHVAMDTHTESYHFAALHRNSIAPFTMHDLNVVDRFGPHQRLGFGASSLPTLAGIAPDDWDVAAHVQFVYLLFPNCSLLVTGDHVELFQILPGASVATSMTHQSYFNRAPLDSDEVVSMTSFLFDMFHAVVRDEDYPCAEGIQVGLASGANSHLVFGRNEPAFHHLHRSYDDALAHVPAIDDGSDEMPI